MTDQDPISILEEALKDKPKELGEAARLAHTRAVLADAILRDLYPTSDVFARSQLLDDLMGQVLIAEADLAVLHRTRTNHRIVEGLLEASPQIGELISRLLSPEAIEPSLCRHLFHGVAAGWFAFRGQRQRPQKDLLDLGMKIVRIMMSHVREDCDLGAIPNDEFEET